MNGSATLALFSWAQTLEMKYCPTTGLTMAGGGETDVNPFGIWNFGGEFFSTKDGNYYFFLV